MTEPLPNAPAIDVPARGAAASARAGWSGEPWRTHDLLLLFGLLVLATVLRLHQLEQWSMAAVEAATWRRATEDLSGNFAVLAGDRRYFLLPSLGLRWLLESGLLPSHGEGWLRLPFAFVGIVTVPVAAVVGSLFVPRRVALLGAAVLAVHPLHVHCSQSVSGHGLVLLAGLAALGATWCALLAHSRMLFAAASACAVVAALSHPMGCFVVVWIAVALLAFRRANPGTPARLRPIHVVGAAAGLCMLGAWWLRAWLLLEQGSVDAATSGCSGWLAAYRMPLLLLAALGSLPSFAGAPGRGDPRSLVVAGCAWLPWCGMALLVAFGAPVAADDALLALLPLAWLAVGAAVRCFELAAVVLAGGRSAAAWLPGSLLLIALGIDLVVATYLEATVFGGRRADWRAAGDAVLRAADRPTAIEVGAFADVSSLLFYLRPNHWRDEAVDQHPGLAVQAIGRSATALRSRLQQAGERGADLFVVVRAAERSHLARDDELRSLFEQSFRLERVLPHPVDAGDETLYVYHRIDTAPR